MRWTALAMLLGVYAVASLAPFDWQVPDRIENGAIRLSAAPVAPAMGRTAGAGPAQGSAEQGWSFPSAGIVVADLPELAPDEETLDVFLEVRPRLSEQSGPARILTVSPDITRRNLLLGQAGRDLIVRLRSEDTGPNGTYEDGPVASIENVFEAGRWVAIDLRLRPGRLTIAIDGEERFSTELPSSVLDSWDPHFRLALGNEMTCNRPWLGTIREAVVATPAGSIDYALADQARAPEGCRIVRNPPQLRPFDPFRPPDAFLNILMYVPLGCLFGLMAGVRSRTRFVLLLLTLAGVSLSFETMQLLLERRFPSIDDLLFNTLGGGLGLWLGFWLKRRLESPQPENRL